jgi:murein DD-endopeptidase MepM/ murein hydrolase activator NlpD
MKRDSFRIALGVLAGVVAVFLVEGVRALAWRWSDVSANQLSVVLRLVFAPEQSYAHIVAAAAGLLAAVAAFLVLAGCDRARWLAGLARSLLVGLGIAAGLTLGAAAGWVLTTPGWRAEIAYTQWWLTDTTPPTVSISAPTTPVRGNAPIAIETSDDGDHLITRVSVDGLPITPTARFLLDTSVLPDGEHTLVVEVQDTSRQRNTSSASAVFRSETLWWMTDVTPPAITLTAPSGIVQGVITIGLATTDQGEHAVTRITLDNIALPLTAPLTIDTARLSDGEHVVTVEAEDASRQRNRGQARATFRSDNLPPTVTVRFDPSPATQGHAQFVYVSVSEPATVSAALGGKALTLAQGRDSLWAVLGFAPDGATGDAIISVRAVDAAGHATVVTATQTTARFTYPEEHLRGEGIDLPPEKAALLAYGPAEITFLDGVFAPITPEQMWQGAFMTPLQGRQTSPFAIRRSYNGGPLDSHHGGVDIAGNMGAPVAASNRGRVVLAEDLKVRGGAVILDHGMGVYSAYYHLSEIKVKKGQMVEKGQIVGLVGSEGLSTGPHLHWEMRVTGKANDPWVWTQRTYP